MVKNGNLKAVRQNGEKMKKAIKILIFAALIMLTMTVRAMAESPGDAKITNPATDYEISGIRGGYVLKLGDEYAEYASISECMAEIQSPANISFSGIICEESFTFPAGSYTISGDLSTEGIIYIASGAEVKFCDLSLSLGETSSIRIRGGTLSVESSQIGGSGSVIKMDYSSSSRLEIKSGVITGNHKDAIICIENGSAEIFGGDIDNRAGAAICNDSELTLSGSPKISGITYDIILESPMSLGADKNEYFSTLPISVQYMSTFEKGSLTEIFYKATERSVSCITLYDKNGRQESITHFDSTSHSAEQNFAGVYLPHKVKFYVGENLVAEQSLLTGEKIKFPILDEQSGYIFDNWYKSREGGEVYSENAPVYSSFSLYGIHKLEPPKFSISSLEFTYDGEAHPLRFDSLTHPIEGGYYSYTWYKNGEKISTLSELAMYSPSDSGIYSCLVTYTVNGKTAEVYAENIKVNVKRQEIPIPSVPKAEYTGTPIYPDLTQSHLYDISYSSMTNVGIYPVTLTLTDSANYSWSGSEEKSITVYFEITKAKNAWTQELTAQNSYVGFPISQKASALFGEVVFLYCATENGTYTTEPPRSVGTYFVKAAVAESLNYSSLMSAPVAFSILPEQVIGLRVASAPYKTEYMTFETFDSNGMEIFAIYDSGREEKISNSRLAVIYNDKKSLRVGDTGVVVEYLGVGIHIPLTVSPIAYDLSAFALPDESIIYDGNYHTSGASPIYLLGLDGIPLICEIRGGGSDAGIYTVTAAFSTESRDYILPDNISATLKIEPRIVDLVWSGSEFVYDGGAKLPEAGFFDVMGAYRKVYVCGSATAAGDDYTATAVPYSENYVFSNPTFRFLIKKADYDTTSVRWSESSFTYTGEAKEVTLENMPQGISVVGYTDNRAKTVGKYSASAAISYDDKNYNPPAIPSHSWEILPAEYDLTGFCFLSAEYEYDGTEHFPRLEGALPVGADGIPLSYAFSRGAINVADGEVVVSITFATNSKNYIAPAPVYAKVKILPKGIYVLWISESFVYNGKIQIPRAESSSSPISISGGGINAGSYIAKATAQDANYTVINQAHSFEIKKAENFWLTPLSAEDFFESGTPNPSATPNFGTPEFRYFSDAALTYEMSTFTPGLCYIVASVTESENYLPLTSSPIAVNCIDVIPVSLRVEINNPLVAFESIKDSISLYLIHNDGTELPIPKNDMDVQYQSGDSLRCSHTSCIVSYGDFEEQIPISVTPATYDTSGVYWDEVDISYDGEAHTPILKGLPSGISVKEYIGAPATDAGEYTFSAKLAYDEENYNPPSIPECVLKIRKATVPILNDISFVYSGDPFTPPTSDLYSYTLGEEIKVSGEYLVKYNLEDSDNYVFENGESSFTLKVNITPAELRVFVSDFKLYLFEREISPEYTVEGNLAEGDSLNLTFYEENGRIYAKTDNGNYILAVESGELEKLPYPSKEMREQIFICLLFIALILAIVIILVKKRNDILDSVYMFRARRKNKVGVGYINNAPKPTPAVDVTAVINIDIEPEIIVTNELGTTKLPELKSSITVTKELAAPKVSEPAIEEETIQVEDTKDEAEEPISSEMIEDEDIEDMDEKIELKETDEDINNTPTDSIEQVEDDIEQEEKEETIEEPEHLEVSEEVEVEDPKIEVRMEYADSMITDTMARRMIKNEREVIYTDGRSRSIINVDTLSRNFMADDRVDVNILKKKSLVPYDTNYIKVLARGAIDKPLHVFANEFSLSAVKMILLSGGEAIRVISERTDKKEK